ncbi:MAG: RHS repeat-associated core domain-containing protein, partial [Chloroflexota bacterium]|nr:RHS repeat-associated core domain-containing protein [Chloroflexota bacterium]
ASVTGNGVSVTHAYNANGSLTSSSDGRTVAYAAFGKATSVSKGGHTSAFAHGPDRSRFKRTDTDGMGKATTTLYIGSVERVTHPDATVTVRRRIGGTAIELDGPAVGSCEADAVRYVLRDHLGGVDRLTDAQGAVPQSMSFAAWGARRDPDDWTELAEAAARSFDTCATTRGFTSHEMLDAVGAVHMNGRLYDPHLGRFLRADPFVQFPANLQSHNRYSYALNNPLSYTDPSGHFLKGLLRPLASIAISVWLPGAGIWTGTGLFAANGIGAVAASGFIAGAVGSGSLKGAVFGAFSAAAFNGLGGIPFGGDLGGVAVRSATYGFVGGVMGVLQGGRFGHGFISAAGAQAFSGPIGRLGNRFQRTAAAAAVGGTLSAATGGKFANGAVTAAFASAFAEREATVSSTEGDDEQANRSAFQKRLNELKRDGTLDPSKDFNTPDDAAKHVLNATAPLSAEYGLEVAGSIYETREGLFRYTFPEIGEATHAFLTMKYRGYHTHPSGELMFSNPFSNSPNTDGNDYRWVRTARKDLYLGVVGNRGAVRIGVCEYRKCSGAGEDGSAPSRIVQ